MTLDHCQSGALSREFLKNCALKIIEPKEADYYFKRSQKLRAVGAPMVDNIVCFGFLHC